MSFERYFYTEGRIKLPTEEIIKWVTDHFSEMMLKIWETYKEKYGTYIEDSLDVRNEYTNEVESFIINIVDKIHIPDGNEDTLYALSYDKKQGAIEISASAMLDSLKSEDKIRKYVTHGIIHELSHAMDPGREFKKSDSSSFKSYINTDVEFPAFVNQYIELIKGLPEGSRQKFLDAIRSGKRVPNKEVADWMGKLTFQNKMKFIKLLVKEIVR